MTVVCEMSRQISILPYRRTFRKPLRTAHGQWSVRQGFILRVEADGGVGFGEIAPIPEFGTETLAEAAIFLGGLVRDPDQAVPVELPCCAFGMSAALAMARGSREGESARSYSVAGLLPAGRAALEVVAEKAALGYRTFKWKVGVEPLASELECLRELVLHLPEGGRLRLDANQGLDAGSIGRWLEVLAAFREQVEYLEQPLPVGQEASMAEWMARSGVPIALDESLNGRRGARWLQAWSGPLVVKPALMGDCTQLLGALRPVAARVVLSSVFETSVGLANALSLADQLPANGRAIGFDTLDCFDDSLTLFSPSTELHAVPCWHEPLESTWHRLLHLNQ